MNEASTAYIPTPDPADAGQTCHQCGYDLTGLNLGSPCPECGHTIGAKKKKKLVKQDTLASASTAYLRRLSIALVVMGLSGLSVATLLGISIAFPAIDYAVRFFSSILYHVNASDWSSQTPEGIWRTLIAIGVILLCALFAASSIAVFVPRVVENPKKNVVHFGTKWTSLRRTAALSQSAWVLVPLLGIAEITAPGHGIRWIAALVLLVAIAGIAPAAWALSDIAIWSNAISVGVRCRVSVCMMGIGAAYIAVAIVLLAIGSGAGLFMVLFSWIFGVLLMLGVLLYFLSSLQLSVSSYWAIINARQESERDERMAERARKRAEKAAIQPQPTFPTEVPQHLADEIDRKHREAEQDPDLIKARDLIGSHQKKVIGRKNTEAYHLEDDENPAPEA